MGGFGKKLFIEHIDIDVGIKFFTRNYHVVKFYVSILKGVNLFK